MRKYTADIDDAFFPRLESVADDLIARPLDMLAVMMSESGVSAKAHNNNPQHLPPEKRWNASGLIQFMPATLIALGWSKGHAAFRELTATQQLDWVSRYYRPYRGRLGSVGALYTATFLPALVGHADDPNYVLTARDGPLGWAYGPNAVFDTNKDYSITVQELEDAVRRSCAGPRWTELKARLLDTDVVTEPESDVCDLGTIRGMQAALARLGYTPGAIDGMPGPRTAAALLAFQRDRGLQADGIYGPISRERLAFALTASA